VLPDSAQLFMKCTPATYIASLYRQVLMKKQLETAFSGNNSLLQEFQEKMGIQINWQELLTKEETYFIVVIISLVAILLWVLFAKVFSKRK
ncbi:ABC transporter permease, partial [Streptococcus oralis]|nr:ABC transporter permease [Streptococcus oralis]